MKINYKDITNFIAVIGCLPVIYFLKENTFEFYKGEGESMSPSINPNDILLVIKQKRNLKRGDIITAKTLYDKDMIICKRLLHKEDDIVTNNSNNIKISKNSIWLEGDNKEKSYDSRYIGELPESLIQGKVIMKIYPEIKIL